MPAWKIHTLTFKLQTLTNIAKEISWNIISLPILVTLTKWMIPSESCVHSISTTSNHHIYRWPLWRTTAAMLSFHHWHRHRAKPATWGMDESHGNFLVDEWWQGEGMSGIATSPQHTDASKFFGNTATKHQLNSWSWAKLLPQKSGVFVRNTIGATKKHRVSYLQTRHVFQWCHTYLEVGQNRICQLIKGSCIKDLISKKRGEENEQTILDRNHIWHKLSMKEFTNIPYTCHIMWLQWV